jgi:hypothetical protein
MNEFIEDYKQQYRQEMNNLILSGYFHPEIAADYDFAGCLYKNGHKATYLIQGKSNRVKYILKVSQSGSPECAENEAELLSQLKHESIPKMIGAFSHSGNYFMIREYFEGVTLEEHIKSNGAMPDHQTRDIALKLCDVLEYLHAQTPPVIHRDIKPQNIIYTADGNVRLIDFGISRKYNPVTANDTTCLGTKEYAPPEQFGFAQTDRRADIYALGVLMIFLLTGDSGTTGYKDGIESRELKRLISKCIAFSPAERYSEIGALKKKLAALPDVKRNRRRLSVLCAAAAAVVAIAAWIYYDSTVYKGTIEIRDRMALSVQDAPHPITRGELARVAVSTLNKEEEFPGSKFPDVPPEHPYYEDISAAYAKGLIAGYPDGNFLPDNPVAISQYAIYVMDRLVGFELEIDWDKWQKTSDDACSAAYHYGILTREQMDTAKDSTEAVISVLPEGIIIPFAGQDARIEWSSSDEKVAKVECGQVTPVSPGTAVITASCGKASATCMVTVTE